MTAIIKRQIVEAIVDTKAEVSTIKTLLAQRDASSKLRLIKGPTNHTSHTLSFYIVTISEGITSHVTITIYPTTERGPFLLSLLSTLSMNYLRKTLGQRNLPTTQRIEEKLIESEILRKELRHLGGQTKPKGPCRQ
eukprot:GHVP01003159.1.p1 GENE.GHVP01003159.1~~GHVP01003159.1.p1  ORF type:complete len:136 (-),score=1.78 GHVP01003159.1:356-763(-)